MIYRHIYNISPLSCSYGGSCRDEWFGVIRDGGTQCHRALTTSEILLITFEWAVTKRTLATVAVVCRAWSDLALDVL